MVDSHEPIPTHTPRKIDYDQVLNPDGSIPKIQLAYDRNINERGKRFNIISEEKAKVGHIILAKYEEGERKRIAYIANILILDEFQRRGFGKATYIEILKGLNGISLQSGVLNERSRGIWEWLVRSGVARKVSDDEGGVYETIVPK